VVVPPPTGTVAQDSFSRTVASGWGSAATGGAWTVSTPAASSVNGSQGVTSHPAGQTRRGLLNSVSAQNMTVSTQVSLDK
ncbi:hypothetical protein ACC691_41060, partial [Rhizobium johnstonii]